MKFTNRKNLPAFLYEWLCSDSYDYNYDPKTFSATSLMKPVRATILSNRHSDKLEIDVLDLIASRLGTAIHDSIEKVETEGVIKEERIHKKIIVNNEEFTISGKFDILVKNPDNTYTLRDIKTTSVWAFILGGKDNDYQKQLSIYKWLLSDDKTITDIAYIDFIFTDWQSARSKTEADYPKERIKPNYQIKLMSLEDTEKYVRERLELCLKYTNTPDDKLPACTKEELWASDDKYAVMKPGAKRATKVCDSQQEADSYIRTNNLQGFVEMRLGKVKRCKFCQAEQFCNQARYYLANNLIDF